MIGSPGSSLTLAIARRRKTEEFTLKKFPLKEWNFAPFSYNTGQLIPDDFYLQFKDWYLIFLKSVSEKTPKNK